MTLLMQDPSPAIKAVLVDFIWFCRFNPDLDGRPMAAERYADALYRKILETAEREQFEREDAA